MTVVTDNNTSHNGVDRRSDVRAAITERLEQPIEIRPARPDDRKALPRLGHRDSATVPAAPLLVASEGGELRAAR